MGSQPITSDKPMANPSQPWSQTHRNRPLISSYLIRSDLERRPFPRGGVYGVGAGDETSALRAVEAPVCALPCPTGFTDRHDLPAVAVEEVPDRAGGCAQRRCRPDGCGPERLRREGVTIDELPRIAAVIGADGGRLLWPWSRPARDDRPPAKPALSDGGVGCTARRRRRGTRRGVESSRAARLSACGAIGPPTRPHGIPPPTSRATLPRSRRPKSKTPRCRCQPSRPSVWLSTTPLSEMETRR